jgi:hypothetical protein
MDSGQTQFFDISGKSEKRESSVAKAMADRLGFRLWALGGKSPKSEVGDSGMGRMG